MKLAQAHPAQPSATPARAYLASDDRALAVNILGAMSVEPRAPNFAALGRIIRAGVAALGEAELEAVLRRGGRSR